jgi:hypothetical protein
MTEETKPLLKSTLFLIERMQTEADEFKNGGKYGHLYQRMLIMANSLAQREDSVWETDRTSLLNLLPEADEEALVRAFQENVLDGMLSQLYLEAAVGKWRDDRLAEEQEKQRALASTLPGTVTMRRHRPVGIYDDPFGMQDMQNSGVFNQLSNEKQRALMSLNESAVRQGLSRYDAEAQAKTSPPPKPKGLFGGIF